MNNTNTPTATPRRSGIWTDPATGYKYWYEEKLAKDSVDICLATEDPEKYCNGTYLYSAKDPGTGLAFVIVKTDDPNTLVDMLSHAIDPEEIWNAKEPRKYK